MNTFLILISMIINIILIFAVIILFLRQNRIIETEKKQQLLLKEMEEVISSYLIQMKEENESFINRVKHLNIPREETPLKFKVDDKLKQEEPKVHKEPSFLEDVPKFDNKESSVKQEERKVEHKEPSFKTEETNSLQNESTIADKRLGKMIKQQAVKAYKRPNLSQNVSDEDVKLPEISGQDELILTHTPPKNKDVQQKSTTQTDNELYMQSLINQVMLLKKQGFTDDEIAKKLNKGRTELELLMKFRQNQ